MPNKLYQNPVTGQMQDIYTWVEDLFAAVDTGVIELCAEVREAADEVGVSLDSPLARLNIILEQYK